LGDAGRSPLFAICWGFAFLISGERGHHLKLSAYAVQPVEAGRLPIFYFQIGFFSFER
jgi:hypothetical protein